MEKLYWSKRNYLFKSEKYKKYRYDFSNTYAFGSYKWNRKSNR